MNLNHPFISMRLRTHHKVPALLNCHLGLLQRHPGSCDEIWFATDYGFPSRDTHLDSARHMTEAAEKVRAAGLVASLQISNTLGHGSYLKSLDFSGITWQSIVGPDGSVSRWSNCPRDPAFHEYLDVTLRAYCTWKPASVWIDDDLRMNSHHPVEHGCFCTRCLAEFSARSGFAGSREQLVQSLNCNSTLPIRRAWIEMGRASLALVAQVITRAVMAVSPETRMGFQHVDQVWCGYNGPDWAPVFDAMFHQTQRPVGSRPGGGFYHDHAPRGMLAKSLMTGLQNERLPKCVDDSRVEIENLPGTVTGKSARGTVLESTLALAYGCNGLTYTPLMFAHEDPAWHERVISEIAAWRPFWLRYVSSNAECRNAGAGVVLDHQHALRPLREGEWNFAWSSGDFSSLHALANLGLPLCWSSSAPVALLHPSAADGLDESSLNALLARGVVTDGESIWRLEQRGLEHVFNGLRTAPASDDLSNLLFTHDALNGESAGYVMGLAGFSGGFAGRVLMPEDPGARILTHYVSRQDTFTGVNYKNQLASRRREIAIGGAEAVLLETSQGGRLAVFGNNLWDATMSGARRAQILAATDWAARGRLPVILDTPGQIAVIPRCDAQGQLRSVLLLNQSLDASPALHLRLRNSASGDWRWVRPNHADVEVTAAAEVVLPTLEAWSVGALICE